MGVGRNTFRRDRQLCDCLALLARRARLSYSMGLILGARGFIGTLWGFVGTGVRRLSFLCQQLDAFYTLGFVGSLPVSVMRCEEGPRLPSMFR